MPDDHSVHPFLKHGREDPLGITHKSFHLLAEDVRDYAIYLLDQIGHIVTWNIGAELIYGYPSQEILDRDFSILYPAEDIDKDLPQLALQTACSEGRLRTEGWRVRKDGSRFWATVVLTAFQDTAGTLHGFGGITHRDAERARAEQEWHHTEQMYRVVMESIRSHIAVIDQTGKIIMVNEAWNRFAIENGVPSLHRVSIGANYLDACRRASKTEESARRTLEGLEAILRGSLSEFILEYPCPSPNTNRWFLLSATRCKIDDGGVVVSHTDITERVIAEQKIKESEKHYRALIENEVDVVSIIDPDGTMRFESPALERSLGYKPEELVGKNAFDFINPPDVPAVKQAIAEVLETNGPSKPIELGFLHKNGSWRILESVARNLLANPAVCGILVTSRDVTERREAEAELRKKEAALESSHAQLQALAGRLLQAEERERRRLSRELHDDLNQKLAALAVDVGALVKSLPELGVQHIERDLRVIQTRVVKVSEEVRTLAYQLHPSILDDLGLAVALRSYCEEFSHREGVEVKFLHRSMKFHVSQGIASCIYRIAQEGLRNIAKHSGAKKATVSLVGNKDHVSLTIRDTGIGFRPESVKARRSLGLTSMSERARLIGGELRVASAPGEGTILKLRAPWEVDSQ